MDDSPPVIISPKLNWMRLGILLITIIILSSIYFISIRYYYPVSNVANYIVDNKADSEEYSLTFREGFTEQFDGPHLYISVSTVKNFPCSNYGLEHEIQTEERKVQINLGKIKAWDMCLTAFGPAAFTLELNFGNGNNTLEINSNGKKNIYAVFLTDNEIKITATKTEFAVLSQTSIKRLPENLLWASCFYNGNTDFDPHDDHCRNFFRQLEQIAQLYKLAEEGRTPRNQFYLYNGLDQPLLELIHQFEREQFYISISTWQGKIFICPTFCTYPGVASVPNLEFDYIPNAKMTTFDCESQNYANEDMKSICLMEVAANTKNESVCEQIPLKDQEQCFAKVGIVKLDENLCKNFIKCFSCQEKCLTYLAVKKNNPDLCELIKSIYRDDCYIEYAAANNDISLCDKVKQAGRIEWCLERFK